MPRYENFKAEMNRATTLQKITDSDLTKEDMKKYISFLRKCYHGKNFESGDKVYVNGEILPLKIAQSMHEVFKGRYSEFGIGNCAIEDIYNFDDHEGSKSEN